MSGSIFNRRLVVLGVREYPDDDPRYTPGFDAQLDELNAWWCTPQLGEGAFTPVTPTITTRSECFDALNNERLSSAMADDILLVYVTGHGLRASSGRHYLRMPDGLDHNPLRTHVRTSDLVEKLLSSDAEHLVLLVNSCFGNASTEDVRSAARELPAERRRLETVGVVAVGDFDDRPLQGELTAMLAGARERLATVSGITTEHLTIDEFLRELSIVASQAGLVRPTKLYPQQATLHQSLALPNPGYRPPDDVVEPSRRDVAASLSDLAYWLDRASGRTGDQDPGWYFSGRQALTGQVASFLSSRSGSLIVTGVAGSGKSALLARAVTLTDSKFLADGRYAGAVAAIRQRAPGTIPPEGSVHAAVLVRNQGATGVLSAIATALGTDGLTDVPSGDENKALRNAIAAVASSHPITVVLDGLDEATRPTDLLSEVLGPLAQLADEYGVPRIRFAVGLRSSGGASGDSLLALAERVLPEAQIIRTDASSEDDIAAYVAAILDHPGSPYRPTTDDRKDPASLGSALDEAASFVAGQVSPSFLDARFVAQGLRTGTSVQDLSDPAWLATLARGTVGLLEENLKSRGTDAPAVLACLRASAFALGRGVPWAEVWPAMAEAVLNRGLPNADQVIGDILSGGLAGFLTQDVEDNRVVYRPVHEGLGDALRADQVELP